MPDDAPSVQNIALWVRTLAKLLSVTLQQQVTSGLLKYSYHKAA